MPSPYVLLNVKEGANHYEVLNVDKKATLEQIRKAFKKHARMWHPDKNSNPQSKEVFQLLQEAHDTLSDEDKRKLYDLKLESQEYATNPAAHTTSYPPPPFQSTYFQQPPFTGFNTNFYAQPPQSTPFQQPPFTGFNPDFYTPPPHATFFQQSHFAGFNPNNTYYNTAFYTSPPHAASFGFNQWDSNNNNHSRFETDVPDETKKYLQILLTHYAIDEQVILAYAARTIDPDLKTRIDCLLTYPQQAFRNNKDGLEVKNFLSHLINLSFSVPELLGLPVQKQHLMFALCYDYWEKICCLNKLNVPQRKELTSAILQNLDSCKYIFFYETNLEPRRLSFLINFFKNPDHLNLMREVHGAYKEELSALIYKARCGSIDQLLTCSRDFPTKRRDALYYLCTHVGEIIARITDSQRPPLSLDLLLRSSKEGLKLLLRPAPTACTQPTGFFGFSYDSSPKEKPAFNTSAQVPPSPIYSTPTRKRPSAKGW